MEQSRDLPKSGASPEPAAAPWEGSQPRRDMDTASVFAWDFQQPRMKPARGSGSAREGARAPRSPWLGFVQNSSPALLWVKSH